MDSSELFYIAPPQEQFERMKDLACVIWDRYDDTYGYATEKKDYIKSLDNVGSNFMTIFNMFDIFNQRALIEIISENTKNQIYIRLPRDYIENYLES